jgi:hypothetical protein
MKTLKKDNKFKRVSDSSNEDYKKIYKMIQDGWTFAPKEEWKKATRIKKEKVVEETTESDGKPRRNRDKKNKR